jgi:ribosomal protein L16 Arg81 hydroxylase
MENEYPSDEANNTPPVENNVVNEPEAIPEPSLLSKVGQAYHALQAKLVDNQQVIQENRTQIAALRSKMRELAADSQVDAHEGEDELHNNKLLVQHDSCGTLISHAEQIREHIYNNSGHAESLLAPLKASVALLELRLQHVRALEQLLENVKVGMALQDRLLEIDLVLESLASKLELV